MNLWKESWSDCTWNDYVIFRRSVDAFPSVRSNALKCNRHVCLSDTFYRWTGANCRIFHLAIWNCSYDKYVRAKTIELWSSFWAEAVNYIMSPILVKETWWEIRGSQFQANFTSFSPVESQITALWGRKPHEHNIWPHSTNQMKIE